MLIGIDGNEANTETKVGIGEFAFELLTQFSILNFKDQSRTDRDQNSKFEVYLKDQPNIDMPKENEGWNYRVFGPKKLWTQWRLPMDLFLHRPRPDVFFTPSHYAPRFSPVPTVVSVMDVSYIHFPELFQKSDLYQLKNWTAYSVKHAKAVITISQSSKDDIIRVYGKPASQVHVVYPGIKRVVDLQPHIYTMSELQTKYKISKNFILFVGTLQPRKNIERLIEAFSLLIQDKKDEKAAFHDLELIIVGKKGWLYEPIINAPAKFGIQERVKFLDFVPDTDLPLLYKQAKCYVLPSLYEGFGLPILEAMKQECPVITSNISSMPEAGGDAALYVNPEDSTDIAAKMKLLLTNEKLRKELIEKGKKQLQKFSWEKTAKETLAILQEVAKS